MALDMPKCKMMGQAHQHPFLFSLSALVAGSAHTPGISLEGHEVLGTKKPESQPRPTSSASDLVQDRVCQKGALRGGTPPQGCAV